MCAHALDAVVGLEIHVQLRTRTKAFCGCAVEVAEPNERTCPVCLGLPGTLPMPNEAAIRMAVLAADALGCTIHSTSRFDRKHYFYPDLPKGYQITQQAFPLATCGTLRVACAERVQLVRIARVHIEEDAGKVVVHEGRWFIDLNRAGVPLVEVVTEPELRSGEEAAECFRELRRLVMFLGICEGNLEQGNLRCDVNVSVRRSRTDALSARVEVKNVNSFRFVRQAVDHEIERQSAIVLAGGEVEEETRGWDETSGTSYCMRKKERTQDYRYLPEPDIPALVLDAGWLGSVHDARPETPWECRSRLRNAGLSAAQADLLTTHPALVRFFDETCAFGGRSEDVARFVQNELLAGMVLHGLDVVFPLTSGQAARVLGLVAAGKISRRQSKQLVRVISGTGEDPTGAVARLGLHQESEIDALSSVCDLVLERHPEQVHAYRQGKTNLIGYFVGKVMLETSGRANPVTTRRLLLERLEESR